MATTQNLQIGSKGDAVKQLQQTLGITADGVYGPETAKAVRAYQSQNGLTVDGVVGPQTIAKIASTNPGPNAGAAEKFGLSSTGNPALDAVQDAAVTHAQNVINSGQTLNPGLTVTPALVSQFLQEAHAQVDPYYQQQITNEIGNINASLDNAQKQYENSVATSNIGFQQDLLGARNTATSNGVAGGSAEQLQEKQMADVQNRNLASLSANTAASVGNTLRTGGSALGNGIAGLNGNQSNFNLPSLNASTVSLGGANGGANNSSALNYDYNPSTYNTGTIPSAYGTNLNATQNQYLSTNLQTAANAPVRSYSGLNTPITTPNTPTLS